MSSFWTRLFERKTTSADLADAIVHGRGARANSGVSVTNESAMRCVTVAACVRVIAESVAQLPVDVFLRESNGGRKEAKDHRLGRLLNVQPNEWQSAYEFREMMTANVAATGNAYAYKVMYGDELRELIPLPVGSVTVKQEDDYRLVYEVNDSSQRKRGTFSSREIMHLRGLSSNGFSGMSPIQLHREAIGLAIASEEHGARTLANGAHIGGFLKFPGRLEPSYGDRLREQWDNLFSGLANTRRTPILEDGMDYHGLQMNAADLQLLDQRKYQRSDIAAIWRIPPHMIGDLEHATFSNIEHQGIEFVTHGLMPWIRRWEATVARDLLPDAQKRYIYIKHNVNGLLRGDIKSRYAAYAVGRQWGWLSADDIRSSEDMDPLPDGKGDLYLTPMNMSPAGEAPPDPQQQDGPNNAD